MSDVFLGLGTNLGDRLQNLRDCQTALTELAPIVARSSLYESEAWGYTEQASFLNMALLVQTRQSPLDFLRTLKDLERQLGRIESFRWGPRLIDIDILFFGERIVAYPQLRIPHPYLHQRAFVLMPLAEIAPTLVHPLFNCTVQALLDKLPDSQGVRRCPLSL